MKKIMITQSILWAAAIITTAAVASSEAGWLMLTLLATIALGSLRREIKKRKRLNQSMMTELYRRLDKKD